MIDFKDHALLMNESYRHWTGEYLLQDSIKSDDPGEVLAELNKAEYALVSHGLEAEPIFNYGNLQALSLFGYEFEDFLQLPTSQTVGEQDLDARALLAQRVEDEGCVQDYQGQRKSKSGLVIEIRSAVVWKLIDGLGRVHGHAARFNDWEK